jgi:hypothetical protein
MDETELPPVTRAAQASVEILKVKQATQISMNMVFDLFF